MANVIKIFKSDNNTFIVQAISIQKGKDVLLVPSPFGQETMVFDKLEDAINQIEKCGYEYSIAETVISNKKNFSSTKHNIEYDKIIDVLVKNLGHENLEIRNSAINALAKFDYEVADKLIEILKTSQNWLIQQSIIKCIEKIITRNNDLISIFLPHLIEFSENKNTLVRSVALKAIEKICDLKNNTQ